MKALIVILIIGAAIALSALSPHLMLNPGKLSQGHIKNEKECSSCHQLLKGISSTKCITCHKVDEIGIKKGQQDSAFTENIVLFHSKLSDLECISCHTDHVGRDPGLLVSNFRHQLLPSNILNKCNSCHNTPKDSLHFFVSASCNNCHNVNDWKFRGHFDHDQLQLSLKNNCMACHQPPVDDLHKNLLDGCSKCHGTDHWTPADFDHDSYFQLDRDHDVKCATCHTNNHYSSLTCFGCHEHSESNIRSEHLEEGITDFTDCASCHRSANKHDLKNGNYQENKGGEEAQKVREYLKKEHHGSEKDDN